MQCLAVPNSPSRSCSRKQRLGVDKMYSLLQPTSLKMKNGNRYHKTLGGRNAKYVVVGAFSRTHVCSLLILCKAAGQGKTTQSRDDPAINVPLKKKKD